MAGCHSHAWFVNKRQTPNPSVRLHVRFLIQAIIILIRAQQSEREINSPKLPSIFRIHIVDDSNECAAFECGCDWLPLRDESCVFNIIVQMVMKHIQIWHLLFDYCVGKCILTMCASFVISSLLLNSMNIDSAIIMHQLASLSERENWEERKYLLKFGSVSASAPGWIHQTENRLEHGRADNKRSNV